MGELIFDVRDLWYRYPGAAKPAVVDVKLHVAAGELVGVVGPNGSGKTTLLRLLLGVLRPTAGQALAGSQPAHTWKPRALARQVGVVVQREEPVFPLRVRQAVQLGRYAHMGALGAPSARDQAAVNHALARCDVAHLSDRWVATLSGGEWQRVRVARALAQEPQALVLDEATASLDVRHEMDVFELVADLVQREGLAGVLVTHRVNLAARFVDRIAVMDHGAARVVGAPRDVLTKEVIESVFAWPVAMQEWDGIPQFVPLRRGDTGQ